jgi:HEAT repeat protein
MNPISVPEPDEAQRKRLATIEGLRSAGAAGVPGLLAMLDDPSWLVRRAVVSALGGLGDAAVEPLSALLRERRDDEARIAATVDALVSSTGAVEPAALALARDPNPAVVADAAQILGRRRSPNVVPTLVSLMEHPDDNVVVAAIEALGRVGGRAAIDALVTAVESRKFFHTFPAIDVLGRSGDPRAVAPLAALLDTPQYAQEACRALGRTADRGAVPPLVGVLTSNMDATVRVAALSLAELRERHRLRYGGAAPVDEAIRKAADPTTVVRRLAQCISGADPQELAALCAVLGAIGAEAAVPILVPLLQATPVAQAAADALKAIGQRAAETQLLAALREGSSGLRHTLLPTLTSPAGTEDVARCLTDPDPGVRSLACDTLARIGGVRAVPTVFSLLGDPDPRVVQAATAAIQSLGSAQTEPLALAAARSENAAIRRAALRILAYFGYAQAFPIMAAALQDPDPRVRDTALQGLPFVEDPRAVELLLEVSRGADDAARPTALRALGQCAPDARVTAALLRGLSDPAPWARYYAAQSIGRLGLDDAAGPLARLVLDPAGHVRGAAVEALSHLRGQVAHDALRASAASDEPDVRRAALIGLGIAKRPESLPLLLSAASSPEAATRLVALSAIAEFRSSRVLAALARAAADPDEAVRTAAIGFLATAPELEATRILVDFLQDETWREQILTALATPTDERVPGIMSMLEGASDELAPWLTSVLARLGRPEATAALFQALASPNQAARKAAATTLSALGTHEAMSALRVAAQSDPAPEVRRVCQLLLAQ